MVKRYGSKSSGQMEGCLDGRYVRFEDYDRLIRVIERAPHELPCMARYPMPHGERPSCTCWKAAALAEVGR